MTSHLPINNTFKLQAILLTYEQLSNRIHKYLERNILAIAYRIDKIVNSIDKRNATSLR